MQGKSLIIPFFHPHKNSRLWVLWLLLALVLLVLTGLGVFRLYFDFDWHGTDATELFSLSIRGGNSFNLFEEGALPGVFWTSLAIIGLSAVLMPFFKPVGAAIIALLAGTAVVLIHYYNAMPGSAIPVEFELLMIFVLFSLYLLLNYLSEIRDRRAIGSLLSQYVPPELAAEYSRNPDSMGMQGDAREITVLFCDVMGFTDIARELTPQEMALWLNAFFSTVSKVVVRHQGTIDKYIGDSVMAFWGAPSPSRHHCDDALAAALDIQRELPLLSEDLIDRGFPALSAGIGISTGVVNVGTLGSEYRQTYTAIGPAVNDAEQLEKLTRQYDVPVVVSESSVMQLDDWLFRELDTVPLKGREDQVQVFQPLCQREDASDALIKSLELHRQAMQACRKADWPEAVRLFEELSESWGPAALYAKYLNGIRHAQTV